MSRRVWCSASPGFQHRGGVRSIKIQGVPGVDVIPMGGGTSNLRAGEVFKIRAGKIHEIEAMGVSLPYGTDLLSIISTS